MIVMASNGYITIEIGEKSVQVFGERCNAGYGNPNFVASLSSLDKWLDGTVIGDIDRVLIRKAMEKGFLDKGWTIEFE